MSAQGGTLNVDSREEELMGDKRLRFFIEQKETKGTKNAFYDCCFLCVLRFLLFKLLVRFFTAKARRDAKMRE
ncbi:hypothetical protein AW736_06335 [Termitidicoccus mucosus]|uniref:Uncharacterized protein n=1 Tax=Termitidicoccus mucosus TaxID=1184151 RepID=A0A178ILS8_9BACT|nr:hypothetical protein AW736_06335 [Opitutaceae bacterium TSB47]